MRKNRRSLISRAIVLAAFAPERPCPPTPKVPIIRVPKSAATLAMGLVDSGEIHLNTIYVNGQLVGPPVAPGSTVGIGFTWYLTAVPGCPACRIQAYIGFQGMEATCFADANAPASNWFSGTLTAPTKPGTYLIMVNETLDAGCQAVTSGGGGLRSIVGVVATLKVK
ncbi:MAG TPA: hypothetical protein VFC51_12145 [Chloroflexota bacterium]|nr:hypothetical protein [Chloroflexota bacterium]